MKLRKTECHCNRKTYRQTETETMGENSNSKTLFYKDCSLGSEKEGVREIETDRDRDRLTERKRREKRRSLILTLTNVTEYRQTATLMWKLQRLTEPVLEI